MEYSRSLMTVHAHPDDEVLYTGGILAKYSREGARTVLVTCTLGQEGHPGDISAAGNNIGEIRRAELIAATKVLGVGKLHLLGYKDSGKGRTDANNHPACFSRADEREAVGRLVRLIRLERPDVLISYDENGDYGHPDHIKAHRITVAAFYAAADSQAYPDENSPWEVSKLYYCYWRPSMQFKVMSMMSSDPGPSSQVLRTGRTLDQSRFQDDPRAKTLVEVGEYVGIKIRALKCHQSQLVGYERLMRLPQSVLHEFAGTECFVLAQCRVKGLSPGSFESDLFDGLQISR